MIAITNKNKVTRYYNPETDYYAILLEKVSKSINKVDRSH